MMWRIVCFAVTVQGKPSVFAPNDQMNKVMNGQGMIPDTYNSVMRSAKDMSEQASLRRYKLQQKLTENEPKLREALATMFEKLTDQYESLKTMRSAVANQTAVIDADVSAGGLTASTRSLMYEVPATQKMLKKVINELYNALQRDSKAINESLSDVEDQYRARIKASATSITTLLAKQDASFASQAYSQERAMKASAKRLQDSFTSSLKAQELDARRGQTKVKNIGAKIGETTQRVSAALRDAEEMPRKITTVQSEALQLFKAEFQTTLGEQEANATAALKLGADDSLLSVENMGMKMAKSFQADLDKAEKSISSKLMEASSMVTKETTKITKEVERSASKAENEVRKIEASSRKSIDQINKKSIALASDSVKIAQDSKGVIDQLGTRLGLAKQRSAVELGTVRARVPQQLQGVVQRVLGTEKSSNADLMNELLRENGGIAYIGQFTDAQVNRLGADMGTKLKLSRTELGNRQRKVNTSIDKLAALLDRNARESSMSTAQVAETQDESLQGLASTMGASLEDLKLVLSESREASASRTTSIRDSILGQNSESLSRILGSVGEMASGATDDLEAFVRRIVGPDAKLSESQMKQIAALLATIASTQDGLVKEQSDLVRAAKYGHSRRLDQIRLIGDRIKIAGTRNIGKARQVGAKADSDLEILKAALSSEATKESESARSAALHGLRSIDSLFGNLDSSFRQIHQRVSGSITGVGNNLDSASKRLAAFNVDGTKRVSALLALAMSFLRQSETEQGSDFQHVKEMIRMLKDRFIEDAKRNAVATTDRQMVGILDRINATKFQEESVEDSMSTLKDSLRRIRQDLNVATGVNEEKAAQFRNRIVDVQRHISAITGEVNGALVATSDDIHKQLRSKEMYLNETNAELSGQLSEAKKRIQEAQQTLRNNLYLYQSKIEGIVSQIRAYMNLSSNADELAIAQSIASQLAAVNRTDIQLKDREASQKSQLSDMAQARASQLDKTRDILSGLTDSAVEVESAASSGDVANMDRLTAVGLGIDKQAEVLRNTIEEGKMRMEKAIRDGERATSRLLSENANTQLGALAKIEGHSKDVASQARKRFVENLFKMDSVNDDLLLTTKQLSELMHNAKASISDISTSVMGHLGLGMATLAKLNSEENRKVASVSDVMNAFSSVVVNFVNETDLSVKRLMDLVDWIDSQAKIKLGSIDRRSKSEVQWVESNLNATADKFHLNLQQERADQEGLRSALRESSKKLAAVKNREQADFTEITDSIAELEKRVVANGQAQIAKVRQWIADRSPQIAKRVLNHNARQVWASDTEGRI